MYKIRLENLDKTNGARCSETLRVCPVKLLKAPESRRALVHIHESHLCSLPRCLKTSVPLGPLRLAVIPDMPALFSGLVFSVGL